VKNAGADKSDSKAAKGETTRLSSDGADGFIPFRRIPKSSTSPVSDDLDPTRTYPCLD
jgi:hypothetical protein